MKRPAKPRPDGKKKSSDARLSKDEIVSAALKLIDRRGADAFSIRELAKELDVYPNSLYWHINGRLDELTIEVAWEVIRNIVPSSAIASWKEWLRTLFDNYRDAMYKHPNVSTILGGRVTSNSAHFFPLVDAIVGRLTKAGFSEDQLVDVFNTVVAALVGYVLQELAPARASSPNWARSFLSSLRSVDKEQFPALAHNLNRLKNRAFIVRWESGNREALTGGYELFRDIILDGLEARLLATHGHQSGPRGRSA